MQTESVTVVGLVWSVRCALVETYSGKLYFFLI